MKTIKTALGIFLYYVLIPFCASISGIVAGLFGFSNLSIILVPLTAVAIYAAFRKSINLRFAALVNGSVIVPLMVIYTILMVIKDGNVGSMGYFNWLIFPYFPVILIISLMGYYQLIGPIAFVTYTVSFFVANLLAEEVNLVTDEETSEPLFNFKSRKFYCQVCIVFICCVISIFSYMNRPETKYSGHGFKYMNGYSSTDFTDYMVYSENSKLVALDHEPELVIENVDDMPVLDGAEACYPLYAAFAKAVYKNIDQIEQEFIDTNDTDSNGRVVAFSNTINGFELLLVGGLEEEYYVEHTPDMFFGARPSQNQKQEAEDFGVEIEVTPIGKEGFVFFVEEDNPIDNLTSEEIKDIYSGKITNWKELGGKDEIIVAFQRPEDSGSQTMMEYFMGDVKLQDPKTYEVVYSMIGVIDKVAQYNNEKGAMGYSFRYFLEELNEEDGVKMISVDGVYPTVENIENGSYPLTTDLCVITRKEESNPYVQKMIDFILSEDGQYIIRETGYAPLSE